MGSIAKYNHQINKSSLTNLIKLRFEKSINFPKFGLKF